MTGKEIIAEATKYLGQNGKKFCADAGIPFGSHWCCAFVNDIFKYKNASKLFCGGKTVVYVPTAQQWLKANCKKVSLTDAQAGDIVIFTWSGTGYNRETGSRDHIGFVRQKGTKDTVYTIEGNTGASSPKTTTVMRRNRAAKYIFAIYRPSYDQYYNVKYIAKNGKGDTLTKKYKVGDKVTLPGAIFKRDGFKFLGWSIGASDYVNMEHFQIGKVKYKGKTVVKSLGKSGQTIKVYACWKGCGPEAAALWARKIAKDNSFNYGTGSRSHHNGCYFCGTNISGIKKAKKGDKWNKTYCCNPFVMAALVHGANLYKKCPNSGLSVSYWTSLKKNGKSLYKKIGKNVAYSTLKPGDVIIKNNKHIKMFTGKTKEGKMIVTQAAREGWDKNSILTKTVSGRIGNDYIACHYVGPR